MSVSIFNKDQVHEKLTKIIDEMPIIKVSDKDSSLFNFQNSLSAEMFVYLLLESSKEFGFEINDKFVDSLEEYSVNNLVDSIIYHAL